MNNAQHNIDSSLSSTHISTHEEEICVLREENITLKSVVQSQAERIRWFEKQLFGKKSEKRIIDNPQQFSLLTEPTATEALPEEKQLTITYQRGTAKKNRPDDCVTDAGLRFSDDVPVEVIRITPPELEGDSANDYDIIDTKISRKLAQQPASYVVLQYEIPVFKHKQTHIVKTTAMPEQVLDFSIADVSLLVGLIIDKFLYHLPLYRQHLRMGLQGVTLSRASLTNWVKRTIELLRPIVEAQLAHVLLSKVLAMDDKFVGTNLNSFSWPEG
jgi:transposase